MTEICVVRHGQSTWNMEHRWAGLADPPLTELGRLQAQKACSTLKKMAFDRITSSSLQRARETASIISNELGIDLAPPVPELNERHYGDICGLTSQEIDARFPGLLDQWRACKIIEIPGGEPWSKFVERVLRGIDIISSFPGRILIVSHEGVLRAIEHHSGENQARHENLEGKWVMACSQSLQPLVQYRALAEP